MEVCNVVEYLAITPRRSWMPDNELEAENDPIGGITEVFKYSLYSVEEVKPKNFPLYVGWGLCLA
jgi:hypothetical protein